MRKINEEELHIIFKKMKIDKKDSIFNELYDKYNNLVYSIAFSLLKDKENSEDITQLVFSKIWNMNLDNFPVKNEASWLYSLTKNETLNYIRKQKNTVTLDELYYINNEDKDINELIDTDSYNRIIARLDKREQEIVSLKLLSNLTFKEISQILNEPIGTVKWRYYKSINTLKIILSNLGMFLVTFVIGLKTMFNKKTKNSIINNEIINEEESIEETKTENSEIEKAPIMEDAIESEEVNETIVIPELQETNINYIGIGMLCISGVFLIFTIFLIKYQLKPKKKVSK